MTDPTDTGGIELSVRGIEDAHAALGEHLFETPLLPSPVLTDITGIEVLLKAENIQRAGSFKVRGSVNKLRKLIAGGRVKEVTAASAGNHAQGVAYAASCFGVASTIYMPDDAPLAKRRATEALGGVVRIEGANYDEARAAALAHAGARGITFIDGFDDWDIIEGQGTIGVELVRALGDDPPDYVLVPTGGGGLLAGILYYLREAYGDRTRIIGVQCDRATGMLESLRAARGGAENAELPVLVPTRPTIADGIRIGQPGARPFEVIRRRTSCRGAARPRSRGFVGDGRRTGSGPATEVEVDRDVCPLKGGDLWKLVYVAGGCHRAANVAAYAAAITKQARR